MDNKINTPPSAFDTYDITIIYRFLEGNLEWKHQQALCCFCRKKFQLKTNYLNSKINIFILNIISKNFKYCLNKLKNKFVQSSCWLINFS